MEHIVKRIQPLLDEHGSLSEPGYALKPVFDYNRKMIKASKWRIKEWDYYACINDDFAFSFTVADLGYLGMCTASFLDFKTGKETKKTIMKPFVFGRFKLPNFSDSGNTVVIDKSNSFQFIVNKDSKVIKVSVKNFTKGVDLIADLTLIDYKDDRMLIATPWKENKKAFYYNQKINCMPTSGTVQIGEKEYIFDKSKHFSVLDWGRGVWTYKNTWYWGSLSGLVKGKRFGFNIGYGFGDTSAASENMIFYDGVAHKFKHIEFIIDEADMLKPWKFQSNDKRMKLTMTPMLDRVDHTNLLIIKNYGHQVFGKFNGYVILDDGTKLVIKDLIGFAEKIMNQY
ncbi:MAG: DUF2804 domain-containing protein [Tenericutes bacterium]|nr:DUF2804 domain-containing protein [Mycoplasmatota bacterium]